MVLLRISILAITIAMMLGLVNAADCKTFTDALGREVSLKGDPLRIIPLAPNLTEILFFLGLGDRVVGVTTHCTYPPEVILISSMERGGRFERARQDWLEFKSIPAVQHERVHLIDSDFIDRPAPRFIQGLDTMVRFIHPEVFK